MLSDEEALKKRDRYFHDIDEIIASLSTVISEEHLLSEFSYSNDEESFGKSNRVQTAE